MTQRTQTLPADAKLVCIGISNLDFDAVLRVLAALDDDLPIAIVLIQRQDDVSPAPSLFERLSQETALGLIVIEVDQAETPKAGHVYVIKGRQHFHVLEGRLEVDTSRGEGATRAPLDHFLHSAACYFGVRLCAIVLGGGTAADGAAGLRTVKARGGVAMAEDVDAESEIFSEPTGSASSI